MRTRANVSFAWKFSVSNSYLCHKIKQLGSKLSLFSNGRDGHEPYSRRSYTHYTHSRHEMWDEFIPNKRS